MALQGRNIWYRDRSFMIRWGMVLGFVMMMVLMLPKNFAPEYNYELGMPWLESDLVAEFGFPLYKTPEEFEAEKARKRARVFVFAEDTAAESQSRKQAVEAVDRFFDDLRQYRALRDTAPERAGDMRQQVFVEEYKVDPDKLLRQHVTLARWQESLQRSTHAFLSEVYRLGWADTLRADVLPDIVFISTGPNQLQERQTVVLHMRGEIDAVADEELAGLPTEDRRLLKQLIMPHIRSNLQYSKVETEREQNIQVETVSRVMNKVREGEIIVGNGETVTPLHELRIMSYRKAKAERYGSQGYFVTFSGQFIVISLITFLMMLFIRVNRPRIFYRNRKLGLVLLVMLLIMFIMVMILKLAAITEHLFEINYVFLAPFCMTPIILAAFFDVRLAFFANIVMAMFAASIVPNGFEVLFIQIFAGTIAVYNLKRLRNRGDFFLTQAFILMAYAVSYLGYNYYAKGSFETIHYGNLVLLSLNVVLTFITYPLIYGFEKIFGLTSDLTFVELLDTNHPLLKELSTKAPGTFQHSLQVANLAEAVLNRIGGNSLQARVGALFHDIGKVKNPRFFIENIGDEENPHDKMDYEESAEIIIGHVTHGVELAQEYNLPEEIINFIRTHHGTTKTEYFYRKYLEEHPEKINFEGEQFRYPGPVPMSREMAVLMLADSVEAASRAMKDRSPEKLKALVNGISESKVRQHQFNNVHLTFRDLENAKAVLYHQLLSIYHPRVEYPESPVPLTEQNEQVEE